MEKMNSCVSLGLVYILLFGILLYYQGQIYAKVKVQLSNATILQEKNQALSAQPTFYSTFKDRCEATAIFSCMALLYFLVYIGFGLTKNTRCTSQNPVTVMTQIAVVLGIFIFFFSIKLIRYAKDSDQQYNTNIQKDAMVTLGITGCILLLSLMIVYRYGNIKEWSVLKFLLYPDLLGRLKNKFQKK